MIFSCPTRFCPVSNPTNLLASYEAANMYESLRGHRSATSSSPSDAQTQRSRDSNLLW